MVHPASDRVQIGKQDVSGLARGASPLFSMPIRPRNGRLVRHAMQTYSLTRAAPAPGPALGVRPILSPLLSIPELPLRMWNERLAGISHAFTPVVEAQTGRCHGFEARIADPGQLGFASPEQLWEEADRHHVLPEAEARLHIQAVESFHNLAAGTGLRLFLDLDNRVVLDGEYRGRYRLESVPLPGTSVGLMVREDHNLAACRDPERVLRLCRQAGTSLGIRDFGNGPAGLRLLHALRPGWIRLGRFFLEGLAHDTVRRDLLTHLVRCAHALKIRVIAAGIDTPALFYLCRDLGCDLVEGPLIGPAISGANRLPLTIESVQDLNHNDRRQNGNRHSDLRSVIERPEPLRVDRPKIALLEAFSRPGSPAVLPIIDDQGFPLGLVRERDLKRFVYSRFGGELLRNKVVGHNLRDLVVRCPALDIHTSLERVVGAFSEEAAADGIIVTEGGGYAGFLGSHALIRLVHERSLALATDQNPLTRLPGNTRILQHLETVLADRNQPHTLVYLDFDHFKPFNDSYGFRQGDRAIILFAEMLKAWIVEEPDSFAGHIGGDDFVLMVSGRTHAALWPRLRELVEGFRQAAENFYDPDARAVGMFQGKDRDGNPRQFPLLAVSGVAVTVQAGAESVSSDRLTAVIAAGKSKAKLASDKLYGLTLPA